jgi:RIO-like serine/threonine protein kinase
MPRPVDDASLLRISDCGELMEVLKAVDLLTRTKNTTTLSAIKGVLNKSMHVKNAFEYLEEHCCRYGLIRMFKAQTTNRAKKRDVSDMFHNTKELQRMRKKNVKVSVAYELTVKGQSYLSLWKLQRINEISEICLEIGSGKEATVHVAKRGINCGLSKRMKSSGGNDDDCCSVVAPDEIPSLSNNNEDSRIVKDDLIVIKFHQIGDVFKLANAKREYTKKGKLSNARLSRLSAQREFEVLLALYNEGLPVPEPFAHTGSSVVMQYFPDYYQLNVITKNELAPAEWLKLYNNIAELYIKMAQLGVVHGDFNQFNLLVKLSSPPVAADKDDEIEANNNAFTGGREQQLQNVIGDVRLIDFPQAISRDREDATEQFTRDLDAMIQFFHRRVSSVKEMITIPSLDDIPRVKSLDVDLQLPGFRKQMVEDEDSSSESSSELDYLE